MFSLCHSMLFLRCNNTCSCSIWTSSTHSGSLRNYTNGVIQVTLTECKMRLNYYGMNIKNRGPWSPISLESLKGKKVAKQISWKVISREQTEISFKYLESWNKITLFRLCFLCTNSGEVVTWSKQKVFCLIKQLKLFQLNKEYRRRDFG